VLAAFGVNHICSSLALRKFDANWSVEGLTPLRERVESFGVKRVQKLSRLVAASPMTDAVSWKRFMGESFEPDPNYIIFRF
jgi:hypothetical protein